MKRFGLLAQIMIWVAAFFFVFQSGHGFYISPGFRHEYVDGDSLTLKVNSLTSINTALPFSHYSLPFCKPLTGVRDSALNLGQLLMGDRIQNSPYVIKMNANESEIILCQSDRLSVSDVEILMKRIDEFYQVNLLLDTLPAIRYHEFGGSRFRGYGFPVGIKVQDHYYVFNHLKLKVLVHKEVGKANWISCGDKGNVPVFTIVGFEVAACSFSHEAWPAKGLRMYDKYPHPIKCDPSTVAKEVKENEKIVFSYEVTFEESEITWHYRWDSYLQIEGKRVHWLSIANSLLTIALLSGFVLSILRTTKQNLVKHKMIEKEGNAQLNENSCGTWKLEIGDVFCAPACPMLFCVVVANGVQILAMACVTVLLAALGFMSPASRGDLLTDMIILYLVSSIAAGYTTVRIWRTIGNGNQKGWVSVTWRVACFFPGLVLAMLAALNFILAGSNSTAALSFFSFAVLVLLWLGIAVPLTFVGGYIGASASYPENPVPINEITREVPFWKSLVSWLFVLGAGSLPYSTLHLELFFILSSFWVGNYYYAFGFLLIVVILVIIVCAEVSIFCICKRLHSGDRQWWWKSFFASGSTAVYVFLYLIKYLAMYLRYMNGPTSAAFYVGYSLLMALAIMLAMGAVGFLSTFWFLRYVLSSANLADAKVGFLSGDAPLCGAKVLDP